MWHGEVQEAERSWALSGPGRGPVWPKGKEMGSAKGPASQRPGSTGGKSGIGREPVTGEVFSLPTPHLQLLTDTFLLFTELLATKKTHTCE